MADVRSLLRQERASRQQTAPRPQKQSATPATVPVSKKRKAAEDNAEERKRTRVEVDKGVPSGFFDGGDAITATDEEIDSTSTAQPPAQEPIPPNPSSEMTHRPLAHPSTTDVDEMDAFLKEMEEAPAAPSRAHAFAAGTVIEAAPMTAAEIAAQAREEQSVQRQKQDEDIEAEKEEAARQLEDEFEEMEGLEERVRKLREKREALRGQSKVENAVAVEPEPMVEDEDDSDLDEEDWDDWGFRRV